MIWDDCEVRVYAIHRYVCVCVWGVSVVCMDVSIASDVCTATVRLRLSDRTEFFKEVCFKEAFPAATTLAALPSPPGSNGKAQLTTLRS